MSSLVRFIVLSLSLFTFNSFAQTYPFRWEGSFTLSNLDRFNPSITTLISFSLQWNETNRIINGVYQDSYTGSPGVATGVSGPDGRRIRVTFAQVSQGIKEIELSSSSPSTGNVPVPVSLTAYNEVGSTIAVTNFSANMTSSVSDSYCSLGFGVLSGYCGQYTGVTSETSDMSNVCSLNVNTGIRLEVLPSTEVSILANNRRYPLGSLPLSPLSNRISMTTRYCGQIPDTYLDPSHCFSLTLEGDFATLSNQRVFNGIFTVRDAVNNDTCAYSLNLDTRIP